MLHAVEVLPIVDMLNLTDGKFQTVQKSWTLFQCSHLLQDE